MQKIPTVFVRDPEDRKHVTREVTPGCEWVLAGEGSATRKYDGTCCMFDGEQWWARREVKDGGRWPEEFQALSRDATTGKTVGWQPMRFSGFAKWHAEAVRHSEFGGTPFSFSEGTYELYGPKVNGNPEDVNVHILIRHDDAEVYERGTGTTLDYDVLAFSLRVLGRTGIEGIVWHHPDGRMAKLKARDIPPS